MLHCFLLKYMKNKSIYIFPGLSLSTVVLLMGSKVISLSKVVLLMVPRLCVVVPPHYSCSLFIAVLFCDIVPCHSNLIRCLGWDVFCDCGLFRISP